MIITRKYYKEINITLHDANIGVSHIQYTSTYGFYNISLNVRRKEMTNIFWLYPDDKIKIEDKSYIVPQFATEKEATDFINTLRTPFITNISTKP